MTKLKRNFVIRFDNFQLFFLVYELLFFFVSLTSCTWRTTQYFTTISKKIDLSMNYMCQKYDKECIRFGWFHHFHAGNAVDFFNEYCHSFLKTTIKNRFSRLFSFFDIFKWCFHHSG